MPELRIKHPVLARAGARRRSGGSPGGCPTPVLCCTIHGLSTSHAWDRATRRHSITNIASDSLTPVVAFKHRSGAQQRRVMTGQACACAGQPESTRRVRKVPTLGHCMSFGMLRTSQCERAPARSARSTCSRFRVARTAAQ